MVADPLTVEPLAEHTVVVPRFTVTLTWDGTIPTVLALARVLVMTSLHVLGVPAAATYRPTEPYRAPSRTALDSVCFWVNPTPKARIPNSSGMSTSVDTSANSTAAEPRSSGAGMAT